MIRAHRENKAQRATREPKGCKVKLVLKAQRATLELKDCKEKPVLRVLRVILLRQYMHNTEIAVTMRLSTILKTIKQPL